MSKHGDTVAAHSSPKSSQQQSVSIRVVGAGTVGRATGTVLAEWGHAVTFVDVDESVRDELEADGYQTAAPTSSIDADVVLISVPTPYDPEVGRYSLEYVEAAVETIAEQNYEGVVAIRSTVSPGTTERLAKQHDLNHVAMVPEFLFADRATQDVRDATELIIGSNSEHARETLRTVFEPERTAIITLTPTEAEFAKLASNCFGATKISFANELWSTVRSFSEMTDAQVDAQRALSAFRMICPWHSADMGLEGGRPYGGACLPKDTQGLHGWAEDTGVEMPTLGGVIETNKMMQRDDY
ncbi:NAD(P)-binding domain-containing protein [Halogeometricum luteum]|uniref:UDP-N-acetyl-D-mannosamine dehydrogenase n=1 Tax=Halogeometricum luteum TaxID=2950537 RepID=A0ABU2G4D5_9EURY|nr:hypothetical protein [Halogeometricum sp. S3BR5-2]MDS0295341.1 hypothetical protein [Halogeometricum sp. S3BR5-2]